MKKLLLILLTYGSLTYAQDIKRPDSYNYTRGVEAIQNNNGVEALEYLNKELEENPNNGYAFSWIALVRNHDEEYGRALTAADKAVKLIPKKDQEYRIFALMTRAQIYRGLEQDEYALKDYNQTIKEFPDCIDAYENRAQLFYEQEKYELADKDYRKIISLDQGSVMGYMGVGRNANAQGRYNDAINQFDYVIRLAPDYSSGYSFRAESYFKQKKYNEAIDDIIKALEINADNKAFYLMLEVADSALVPMVSKFKVQANKSPNNDYWPYCLGVIYEKQNDYSKAIEFYSKAYIKDGSPITAYRIANCYDDLGNYSAGLKYIEEAIAKDSSDYSFINMKANILDNAGRSKEAIEVMDKYVNLNPEYYFGYYRRGWIKDHSGDIDGAIEDYSMAIALEPQYAYTYLNRGVLYRLKGEKEFARNDFEQVILRDTVPANDNTSHYAYYYLGEKEKAIEFLNKALELNDKGNYYDAACLYSIMGDIEQSIFYLRKALQAGFRRFAHLKRDRDLNNVRNTPMFKTLIKEYELKYQEELSKAARDVGVFEEKRTEIPFIKEGDVIKVKCSINNLPLHFIFDTGASNVSMSSVEASFMLKNGYLSSNDIEGKQYYLNANGEINEGTVINLRDVEFGGLHLSNIKASIVRNQKAPLLLGQSVLQKLGIIEIDNTKQILKITYKKQVK